MKFTLTLAALTLIAAPAFADEMADAAKLTCADFTASDTDAMMKSTMMVKEAMKDDAKTAAMSDEDVMKSMMEACKMNADAMVMDALKMK